MDAKLFSLSRVSLVMKEKKKREVDKDKNKKERKERKERLYVYLKKREFTCNKMKK